MSFVGGSLEHKIVAWTITVLALLCAYYYGANGDMREANAHVGTTEPISESNPVESNTEPAQSTYNDGWIDGFRAGVKLVTEVMESIPEPTEPNPTEGNVEPNVPLEDQYGANPTQSELQYYAAHEDAISQAPTYTDEYNLQTIVLPEDVDSAKREALFAAGFWSTDTDECECVYGPANITVAEDLSIVPSGYYQ